MWGVDKFFQIMTILYFTTTGNSLALAKKIGGKLMSIAQLLKRRVWHISDPEGIGVVCPVYFGRVPEPVERFLASARLDTPYRFALLTCGSTPAMAVRRLTELCQMDYVASLLTVDNYFPMFDVEAQVRELPSKRVEERTSAIVADVAARVRRLEPPTLYGRVAGLYMRLCPKREDAYKRFYVLPDVCNGCRVCERVCPIGNITFVSGQGPEIGADCLTCGGCYHNCPSKAIRYRGEKSRYSYRNPAVSLAEIIDSNSQIE